MNERSDRRDEMLARLALAAADAAPRHLDDNDLALLEMGALSESESRVLRRHLRTCHACRLLAAEALHGPRANRPASQPSLS